MWGKVRHFKRFVRRNPFIRGIFFLLGVVLLTGSCVLGSVTGNVFLHESAHYLVADHYGLDPEIHIEHVVALNDAAGVRFNTKPTAYTLFTNPQDDLVNLRVTLAGPLMNVAIALMLAALYIGIRLWTSKKVKYFEQRDMTRKALQMNTARFIVDVIFVSLLVPTLVSIFVNFSALPGADGLAIRELLAKL